MSPELSNGRTVTDRSPGRNVCTHHCLRRVSTEHGQADVGAQRVVHGGNVQSIQTRLVGGPAELVSSAQPLWQQCDRLPDRLTALGCPDAAAQAAWRRAWPRVRLRIEHAVT